MSATNSVQPQKRRRGAVLEDALLEAAWGELSENGFARLTMERVAARAHTGVAVLYRRWANKDAVVFAALQWYRRTHPVVGENTGSLRGDLLSYLTSLSRERATFTVVAITTCFSGMDIAASLTPVEMRDRILDTPIDDRRRPFYLRAAQRGELDLARVPQAVLALPIELVRYELMMTSAPVPRARIEEIVDEISLPLLQPFIVSSAQKA